MLNKVMLIGHVGKPPEIRTTQAGDKVASFSIATSERWKDKSGERQERTTWHRIVAFPEGLVGLVERFVDKGSKVYVEGKLSSRKYEKDGIEHTVTEVILDQYHGRLQLLDKREEGDAPRRSPAPSRPVARSGGNERARQPARAGGDELDDDIPF